MNALINQVGDAKIRVASLSQTINAAMRGSSLKKWFILPWFQNESSTETLQSSGNLAVFACLDVDVATDVAATSIVRTAIPHSFFNGRMISPDLLASSVTGSLPNGRETWTSSGQLVEDVVSGRVLTKTTGALATVANPFAIFIDQIDEVITVMAAPNPSAGYSFAADIMETVYFELIRSTSPDWFE